MQGHADLTGNQTLLWSGQRIWPDQSIYNEVTVFVIEGRVDRAHFERAFQAAIDRTDLLRAVIEEVDGRPRLRVNDRCLYSPKYVDLSSEGEQDRALERFVRTNAGKIFDLSRAWFDTALIKLSEARYAWYLLLHHVFADAASMEMLYRRVADLYTRAQAGPLEAVGEFPRFLEYAAYAQQQQRSLAFAEAKAYWTRKIEMPRDSVVFYGVAYDPRLGSKEQERIRHDFGIERSTRIRRLARQPGVRLLSDDLSVFSILAAVLFAFLHRLSGNDRIAIGVPWQNRPARFADTLGLLMEQDPFEVSIDEGETFQSLIRKVQGEALEVMRHLPYSAGNPNGRVYSVDTELREGVFGRLRRDVRSAALVQFRCRRGEHDAQCARPRG